jgi:hypothetical protein
MVNEFPIEGERSMLTAHLRSAHLVADHLLPILPELNMAQQQYLEQQLRDLLSEIRKIHEEHVEIRERIVRIETNQENHEAWATGQAARVRELEAISSSTKIGLLDTKGRLDWWAWVLAGGGAIAMLTIQQVWSWLLGH